MDDLVSYKTQSYKLKRVIIAVKCYLIVIIILSRSYQSALDYLEWVLQFRKTTKYRDYATVSFKSFDEAFSIYSKFSFGELLLD